MLHWFKMLCQWLESEAGAESHSNELTAIPTSLFKDYAMRKSAKAQLAKALMSNVQPSECNTQIITSCSRWQCFY